MLQQLPCSTGIRGLVVQTEDRCQELLAWLFVLRAAGDGVVQAVASLVPGILGRLWPLLKSLGPTDPRSEPVARILVELCCAGLVRTILWVSGNLSISRSKLLLRRVAHQAEVQICSFDSRSDL